MQYKRPAKSIILNGRTSLELTAQIDDVLKEHELITASFTQVLSGAGQTFYVLLILKDKNI